MPKYTKQIVVFLDILGFSNLLCDFEQEALKNDLASEDNYHESDKLNKLISIFENGIKLLKDNNLRYYLFSDNLCISIDFIDGDDENPSVFADILSLLAKLFYEFMKEGYFLRGAIDVGWFLNYDDMAIGIPLSNAYYLESNKAIYPRIILSDNYIESLAGYKSLNKLPDYQMFIVENYIIEDSNLSYLNPLLNVVKFEDKMSKIEYFQNSSQSITSNLGKFKSEIDIYLKYEWLAQQFNNSIELYVNEDAYKVIDDDQLDFSELEIDLILNSKISFDGI